MFLKGEDKDFVTKILDSCGFYPFIGIRVLIDKSLITILDKKLWMHDLLQELGWEIVRQESINEPGKRSRLWFYEDAYHVLKENTGTEAVEGIILDLSNSKEEQFSTGAFARMNKLRLLKVCNSHLSGGFKYLSDKELRIDFDAFKKFNELKLLKYCKVHLSGDSEFLSNELRCLCWQGYPLKSLASNFHSENLVELNMCYSRIEQLWEGVQVLEKLKFIKLSHSQYFIKTPDFSRVPNLERLILEGCTSLLEVHPSAGFLKRLVLLNLKDCKNLRSLPSSIELDSLENLILSGCSKLKKFPKILRNMEHISELYLDGTAIKELPTSIEYFTGLVLLHMKNCNYLTSLPNSICKLKSLQILTLSGCSQLDKLPENLGGLECLSELRVDGTAIKQVPSSIVLLKKLKELSFHGCKGPAPTIWTQFTSWLLPRKDSMGLAFPSFSGLCSLERLDLSDCNLLEGAIPSDLGCLSSLKYLNLSRNNFVSIPSSVAHLSRLTSLYLECCKRLRALPELPSKIENIDANSCTSLETLSSPSSIDTAKNLGFRFTNCFNPQVARFGCRYRGFIFTNCCKLVNEANNGMGNMLLKCHLQRPFDRFFDFNIILPGREIPKWFSHQNVGSTISIQLPPKWYNSKFKGLAVSAIFAFKDVINGSLVGTFYCSWKSSDDYQIPIHSSFINFGRLSEAIRSDHIWLAYEPRDLICCGTEDRPNHWTQLELFFSSSKNNDPSIEVKMCGVRLVYDDEDDDPTVIQSSSSLDNLGSNYHGEDTTLKRSHQDYNHDEAEPIGACKRRKKEVSPSGSHCSNEDDPIQTHSKDHPPPPCSKLKGKCL